MCGIFAPARAVVGPCRLEWRYRLVYIIVDLIQTAGIDLAPYLIHATAEIVVLYQFAYPVRCDLVVYRQSESVVRLFTKITAQISCRTGNPFAPFPEIFMEIETAVEAVRIVHYLLEYEETCHALDIDISFPVGRV